MIALLGFGKTNQSLLRYINSQGMCCVVCDDSFIDEREDEFGNIFTNTLEAYPTTLQIPSPGIPPYNPMIKNSTHLLSDYDYILSGIQAPQIWISGTNGKTTTTEMLEWVLKDFGGVSGGNIGTPLATLATQMPKIWILETSSFSLHYTQKVFPYCYILLPLSEDHISWHGSFEGYVEDKLSVLERMGEDNVAFIPKSLSAHPLVEGFRGKIYLYENSEDLGKILQISPQEIPFKEPFLLDALLALGGAEAMCGCKRIEEIRGYQIGLHKMQEFYDKEGRVWINDSKGTNVDATIWALRSYPDKQIYLILGGDDKGADLEVLFKEMSERKIEIFAIGKNALKIQELANTHHIPCQVCYYLEKAVEEINSVHTQESIALLSPAAASLDQFISYKHRGEEFMKLVENLH